MTAHPLKRARFNGNHSPHARLFGTGELSPPVRCAVIVAHPGDEIVGAGCLIAKLTDVFVLHVTDGEHPARSADHPNNLKSREEECLDALALADVPSDRVESLKFSYAESHRFLTDITKRTAHYLQQTGADIVVTHPYEGGHPDHDATAFAVHSALRLLKRNGFQPPVLFEMALHPGEDAVSKVTEFLPGPDGDTTTLLLNQEAINLKRRMFDCFKSQSQSMQASPLGPERFRQPGKYDFTVAPRGGPYYESFGSGYLQTEWPALATRALQELFPDKKSAQGFHARDFVKPSPSQRQ